MGKLAPYLRKKMRPILFMGGDKTIIRSETISSINKMMIEVEATHTIADKTLEVSISGDTMQTDRTNVFVNIDEDPFNQPEPISENIQNQLLFPILPAYITRELLSFI